MFDDRFGVTGRHRHAQGVDLGVGLGLFSEEGVVGGLMLCPEVVVLLLPLRYLVRMPRTPERLLGLPCCGGLAMLAGGLFLDAGHLARQAAPEGDDGLGERRRRGGFEGGFGAREAQGHGIGAAVFQPLPVDGVIDREGMGQDAAEVIEPLHGVSRHLVCRFLAGLQQRPNLVLLPLLVPCGQQGVDLALKDELLRRAEFAVEVHLRMAEVNVIAQDSRAGGVPAGGEGAGDDIAEVGRSENEVRHEIPLEERESLKILSGGQEAPFSLRCNLKVMRRLAQRGMGYPL
ncbi:hypothetical protein D3C80_1330020 [compost metagenome]